MTLLAEPQTTPAGTRRRPRAWPPLVVAAGVAVLSVAGALLRWPAPIQAILVAAAIVVTLWAAWAVIRRPSRVVAPLAVCLVALGNPLALGGMATNIEAHAGLITVRTDGGFGLVFWKQYPGVAGWTAPSDPQPVDTVAFAAAVQAAVRSIVDDTTTAFGLTWTVASQPSGLMQLSNGYGGPSMFDRVDSAQWHTMLDGSAAQRTAVLAATRAAATTLQLGDEKAVSGDPLTGAGTTTWSDADADGELTLVLDADAVTVSYSGGPLLTGTSLPGEFERRMADFAGLTPPAPLVTPDVPQR